MLTVHAMGWNRKKGDSLHQALSTRYVKVSLLLKVLCPLSFAHGLLLIIASFNLDKCSSSTVYQTSKRLLEETASLEELKTELHCVSDDMVSTWISDVKEWASGKHDEITPATYHCP